MRKRVRFVLFSVFFALITVPTVSFSQDKSTANAVAISSNYYNSIVKILLYDSVYAKKHPENAYLGRGSGFIVRSDGYIFTNKHVISFCTGYCRYRQYNPDTKTQEYKIEAYKPSMLSDPSITKIEYIGRASAIVQIYDDAMGSSYKLYVAKVIAIDSLNFDGAIIKIVSDMNGKPVDVKFHPVPIGNSDSSFQGQDLCLYGFPAQYNGTFDEMLKDESTLKFGKHSGFDFYVNTQYGLIKTDAVISSGNSGGPVFGEGNRVIGIATAAFNQSQLGLIGGINAMYDLAALVPNLLDTLTAKGLTRAERVPMVSTAYLYKPLPLPTKKSIHSANTGIIKSGVVNSPVLIDIIPKINMMTGLNYQISSAGDAPSSGTIPSSIYSVGGNYALKQSIDAGLNLRLSLPNLIKIKSSRFGILLNFSGSYSNVDWSPLSSSIYYYDGLSQSASNSTTFSSNPYFYGSGSAGISYTYLFGYKTSISIYYAFGLLLDLSNSDAGSIMYDNNKTYTNGDQPGNYDISYQGGSTIDQTIGLIFRYKHLILGAEYSMIGSEDNTFTVNNNVIPTTLAARNTLNILVGLSISPRHSQH